MSVSNNPSRPRVGVDFHTFDGIFQGSRSHLVGVYREAIALAPDIDFVFLLGHPEQLLAQQPGFKAPNVTLVEMPHRPALWRLGVQLALLQRKHKLDLLHVQYRLPFIPLGPCACTIHDVLFETHPQFFSANFVRMARWSSRIAVARSKALFTVSQYSRDSMASVYKIPPESIAVTHNGVDTGRFFPGDAGSEVPALYGLKAGEYISTVGRLEPRKNHLCLIRAYAGLPKPRPPLVVIGQRDFGFEQIFAEVEKLGLTGEVVFLDSVADAHLPVLLRHSRLFIYASYAEGFGMPVLEAMASGVPVITTYSTSLPEVAGDAARLVAVDDVPALTAEMKSELALSPAEYAARREGGLRQADKFTWRSSAEVLVSRFRSVIGKPAR